MTEERLIEVLSEAMSANGFGHIRELFELNKEYVEKNLYVKSAMEAMKKAVNEALDDAAENGTLLDPAMNIKCKSGHGFVVDKQSILKLKVK